MQSDHALKLFGLNNLSIESDIRRLEAEFDVDLGHRDLGKATTDQTYYPQFSERLRDEAGAMAVHYSVFYCLENSIRNLIVERLKDGYPGDWWTDRVPEVVRKNAEGNRKKEVQSGVTLRSDDLIDYTTFGELGEIIKSNQDVFGDMFRDIRAVERILHNLNTLRGPIAHCKALAPDEVLRLDLALRDWFRQMS